MECNVEKWPKLNGQELFQCKSIICRKQYSIRTNSFWFKSKLPLNVLIGISYFFAIGSSFTELYKHSKGKISKPSIIQSFSYFRDLMTTYFVNNRVIFNNCTVLVDETFIGSKRKYGRGWIPKRKRVFIQNNWPNIPQSIHAVHSKQRSQKYNFNNSTSCQCFNIMSMQFA